MICVCSEQGQICGSFCVWELLMLVTCRYEVYVFKCCMIVFKDSGWEFTRVV